MRTPVPTTGPHAPSPRMIAVIGNFTQEGMMWGVSPWNARRRPQEVDESRQSVSGRSRSVAAAAPALAAPRETMPGPPGRPVAVGRCLVEARCADRLADQFGHVDAVVADDRRVCAGVGALHVVFAEDARHLREPARCLAAEGLGRRDDAGREALRAAADRKASDRVGEVI